MTLALAIIAALAVGAPGPAAAAVGGAAPAASRLGPTAASLTVSVEGVSCASCTLSIRRALKKVEGVQKVEAGSASNTVVITYDAVAVKPEQIVQTIDGLGYKATAVAKSE